MNAQPIGHMVNLDPHACELCGAGPNTPCEPYCPATLDMEDDPAYVAWEQAQEAIQHGLATELTQCEQCVPVQLRFGPDAQTAPLRGILARTVIDSADPTMIYRLSCGHIAM